MRFISYVLIGVLSLSAVAEDKVKVQKEFDTVMTYPYDLEESVKLGIALAEGSWVAYNLLKPGKREAIVNDERISQILKAKENLERAEKMMSESDKAARLQPILKRMGEIDTELGTLKSAENAAKISELSAEATQLNLKKISIEALKSFDDATKASAIEAAKKSMNTAARAIVADPEIAVQIKPTTLKQKTLGVIKHGTKWFAMVDLGVKGYFWVALDSDPGYSPAGEGVYHGVRRLYKATTDAVSHYENRTK